MKKSIVSLIFAIMLFFGIYTSEAKATAVTSNFKVNQTILRNSTDNYIYVKILENNNIWIYVYTTDGIFVTKYISVN